MANGLLPLPATELTDPNSVRLNQIVTERNFRYIAAQFNLFNVLNYVQPGYKPGVTDALPAFQSAILDSRYRGALGVYMPPGYDYGISASIDLKTLLGISDSLINQGHFIMRGDNPYTTRIVPLANIPGGMITCVNTGTGNAANARQLRFKDFSLYSDASRNSGHGYSSNYGFHMKWCAEVYYDNINIINCVNQRLVYHDTTFVCNLTNCTFVGKANELGDTGSGGAPDGPSDAMNFPSSSRDARLTALYFSNTSTTTKVDSCRMNSCRIGVNNANGDMFLFHNNAIESNTDYGAYLSGSTSNINIEANYWEGNGGNIYVSARADNLRVVGNFLHGSSYGLNVSQAFLNCLEVRTNYFYSSIYGIIFDEPHVTEGEIKGNYFDIDGDPLTYAADSFQTYGSYGYRIDWSNNFVLNQVANITGTFDVNGNVILPPVSSSGGSILLAKSDWSVIPDKAIVRFATTVTLPVNIAANTDYWIDKVDVTTVKLSTSYVNALAHVNVAYVDAGTGALSLQLKHSGQKKFERSSKNINNYDFQDWSISGGALTSTFSSKKNRVANTYVVTAPTQSDFLYKEITGIGDTENNDLKGAWITLVLPIQFDSIASYTDIGVTFSNSAGDLLCTHTSDFPDGSTVRFSGGVMPGNISANTSYQVVRITALTCKLTAGAGNIAYASAGSGSITMNYYQAGGKLWLDDGLVQHEYLLNTSDLNVWKTARVYYQMPDNASTLTVRLYPNGANFTVENLVVLKGLWGDSETKADYTEKLYIHPSLESSQKPFRLYQGPHNDIVIAEIDNPGAPSYGVMRLRTQDGDLSIEANGGPGSVISYGPTGGIGYGAGSGGTVAQNTSKATGVTLSKVSGKITMDAAALAAGTAVSFILTNTTISATDVLGTNYSGGTDGAYVVSARCGTGSAVITLRNLTAVSLSEAVAVSFVLHKGSHS